MNRKIVYPAGITTLTLLPLFCILNLQGEKLLNQKYAMDVAVFDFKKTGYNKDFDRFSKAIPTLRKYKKLSFSGVAALDLQFLKQAKAELQKIAKAKDTINGLSFTFGNEAKYWNWAATINLCQKENVMYWIDRDQILAYYRAPDIYKGLMVKPIDL